MDRFSVLLTSKKQLNTAQLCDFGLKFPAFFIEILSIAVENVHVFLFDVDVFKEMIPHEGMIRLRVIAASNMVCEKKCNVEKGLQIKGDLYVSFLTLVILRIHPY